MMVIHLSVSTVSMFMLRIIQKVNINNFFPKSNFGMAIIITTVAKKYNTFMSLNSNSSSLL